MCKLLNSMREREREPIFYFLCDSDTITLSKLYHRFYVVENHIVQLSLFAEFDK